MNIAMADSTKSKRSARSTKPATAAPTPSRGYTDNRRRTNRTLQFSTRVTPEFDERIRAIARRDGLLLVEVLERALEAYEEKA